MVEIFKHVDKFFISLTNYLTYNHIFIIFVGLMLFTMLLVTIFTARSYEAKLIRAVDKFNSYFIDNPQINEDNLVAFNAKMKEKRVPKQLRKSWQQFVLYREGKASSYMSFENCVSNPMKNSTYTRDIKILNVLSWIFSVCALILNCYYCFETNDIAMALRGILLTPVIIMLLNFLMQIFLNLRHTAIVSDLFQNYQYFEVNIDKATETLPEYVDYEVLFDRNEIKKGIPILYAYLQKRAEEEQRELERARIKNVEHEKFNFDEEGIAAALVLERAMQEAENYMAERKKFNQDAEQVNSELTQEDLNYREITKEYNRQMQVSKETFANFKSQLEDASSSIEANYLKKQQQQELDRQRNLERDFDTATERHKKVVDGYYAELDTIDKFIAQSRQNLEKAMKSEFENYSSKVYDEAKQLVEVREQEKYAKLKQDIINLEEELVRKNQEVESISEKNQLMAQKIEDLEDGLIGEEDYSNEKDRKKRKDKKKLKNTPSYVQETEAEPNFEFDKVETEEEKVPEYKPLSYEPQSDYSYQEENTQSESEENVPEYRPLTYEAQDESDENVPEYKPLTYEPQSDYSHQESNDIEEPQEEENFEYEEVWGSGNINEKSEEDQKLEPQAETAQGDENLEAFDYAKFLEQFSTETNDDGINANSESEGATKVVDEEVTKGVKDENLSEEQPKRKAGRPRKEKSEEDDKPKRSVGRPRKEKTEEDDKPKRSVGRPRKEKTEEDDKPKRSVGRPRKEKTVEDDKPKRSVGRPRKESTEEETKEKRKPGRPKKQNAPKGTDLNEIQDIDKYLQEIDDAIAAENEKIEKTQKELAKNTKLKRKK